MTFEILKEKKHWPYSSRVCRIWANLDQVGSAFFGTLDPYTHFSGPDLYPNYYQRLDLDLQHSSPRKVSIPINLMNKTHCTTGLGFVYAFFAKLELKPIFHSLYTWIYKQTMARQAHKLTPFPWQSPVRQPSPSQQKPQAEFLNIWSTICCRGIYIIYGIEIISQQLTFPPFCSLFFSLLQFFFLLSNFYFCLPFSLIFFNLSELIPLTFENPDIVDSTEHLVFSSPVTDRLLAWRLLNPSVRSSPAQLPLLPPAACTRRRRR